MSHRRASGDWSVAAAQVLYNVERWGEGYFAVGDNGHALVRPRRESGPSIDLYELSRQLPDRGLALPVLLRFTDILHDRVETLTAAFAEVAGELGYAGRYTAVYPIKVNQQADVIRAIVEPPRPDVGLEAGSKPELAAVLALAPPGAPIVCNGYKDRAYVRRALIGQKLGHRVYLVVEKLSELPLALEEGGRLGVVPRLGLRVRLSSRFASTQQNTGGEKSKFGLTPPQLLEAVATLRAADRLDALSMLHVHLGSQVANVADIRLGLREAARVYVELRRAGAPLSLVDVGGGLGVDYEGTRSRSQCSMNYSLREYARNVLRSLTEVCAEAGEPVPDVISESGRALTAHHAVLLTSVIDQEAVPDGAPPPPAAGEPAVLHELNALIERVADDPLECLHDATHLLGEAQAQFVHGSLSLAARAQAEAIHYAIARAVLPQLDSAVRAHREAAEELHDRLGSKYFCNFSVFQSMPDAWAIDQVFPIMPLHRLDERPQRRARLCDLTCDSDGKLERYVDRQGVVPTLAVHSLRPGQPYLLGVFLVGAYQEILGDMHNLFGDTNAVNVVLDATAEGGFRLSAREPGDSTADLLRYVHLEPAALEQRYRDKLAAANLPADERGALLAELRSGLSGYTYLT